MVMTSLNLLVLAKTSSQDCIYEAPESCPSDVPYPTPGQYSR